MLTMLLFAISVIVSLFFALPATLACAGKKKLDQKTKAKSSSTQKLSGASATSVSATQKEDKPALLDATQSPSVKPKPKVRILAVKPQPEKKANSASHKSKSKRKAKVPVANDKSTEREEKIDGDSETQEVVPEHLVKVMGDLDHAVNRAELEKEIEAMKSVHELEDEVPQGKMRAKDVQIAQDNCKLFQTNTKAFNKEKQMKKTDLAAKKLGKSVEANAAKPEDSSLSYRPNF